MNGERMNEEAKTAAQNGVITMYGLWGYSSVLKHLPHICETLGFVPSTTHAHIHNSLLILCSSQKICTLPIKTT